MKAVLEFNLPEDSSEHELALSAGKLHSALWDLSQILRSVEKYDALPAGFKLPENVEPVQALETLIEFRRVFYEVLRDAEVTLG